MKALDYLDMPACIMNTVPVYLDDSERRMYEQLKKEYILPMAEGGDVDAANAAALSGKLLQLAGGAVYDECHHVREFHSRKLDALEDLIEAAALPQCLSAAGSARKRTVSFRRTDRA